MPGLPWVETLKMTERVERGTACDCIVKACPGAVYLKVSQFCDGESRHDQGLGPHQPVKGKVSSRVTLEDVMSAMPSEGK